MCQFNLASRNHFDPADALGLLVATLWLVDESVIVLRVTISLDELMIDISITGLSHYGIVPKSVQPMLTSCQNDTASALLEPRVCSTFIHVD